MRIAIVCSYYPWPPSVGGVETIVRNVSTELARRGHEVHVVATPFDVTTGRQVSGYGVEEQDGVIIHKLRPGRIRVGYARLLNELKQTMQQIKPEIVHSHNLHPHLFQLAVWKDELGYRLVVELHHPAVNLDFFTQKMLLPFVTYWFRKRSTAIDIFLAHTNLEKSWLKSRGIRDNAIKVIRPPLISSDLFSYKSIIPKNSGYLLYLGRIVPKKGLHVLIKALSLVNDAELIVAGPAEERYHRKLRNLVAELKLQTRVKFVGRVAEQEKSELMSACSIFVCPTLADYHPIVLVEAQALGVPVIATKVGAIPEIVLHGRTGLLVKPNDAVELGKAIKYLLENGDLMSAFSKEARQHAKLFTLESFIDRLGHLYRTLLGNE